MDVNVAIDMFRTIETQAPQLLEMYKQQTYALLGVAGTLLIISFIIGLYIFAKVRRWKKLSEHCSAFEIILDYYFGRLLVAILLAAFGLVLLSSGSYNLYMINFFPHEFLLDMLFS